MNNFAIWAILNDMMVFSTLQKWFGSRAGLIILGTALASLIGELLLNRVVAHLGISVDGVAGLVLPLGVALGPWAAIGAGLGVVSGDIATGTFGSYSAVGYLSTFVLVFSGLVFYSTLDKYQPATSVLGNTIYFLIASVPAALATAAIQAWGSEIFQRSPFAVTYPVAFMNAFLGGVLVGVPVLLGIQMLNRELRGSQPAFRKLRTAIAGVLLLVAWGAIGVSLSLIYQPFQLQFTQRIANQLGWAGVSVVKWAGPRGRNLQLILGFVGMILLLYLAKTLDDSI